MTLLIMTFGITKLRKLEHFATLSIMTFSIIITTLSVMTLRIMAFSITKLGKKSFLRHSA